MTDGEVTVSIARASAANVSAASTGNLQKLLESRYQSSHCLSDSGVSSVWWVLTDQGPAVLKAFAVSQQAAYRREASLALGMRNSFVVRCIDTLVLPEGYACLLYEYMTHGSVADLVSKAVLGEAQVREIARATLQGLATLHMAGYVHCDIKPSNILATSREQTTGALLHFKLGDLGSAASLREARSGQHGIGSPAYCAPERLYCQFDFSSDLYSVGIMVYELLSGHLPFMGGIEEIYRAHITRPAPLANIDSLPWREWLGRLLAKQPHERFACATDALAALPEVQDSLGIKQCLSDYLSQATAFETAKATSTPALPRLADTPEQTGAWPGSFLLEERRFVPQDCQLAGHIQAPCTVDTVAMWGETVVLATHRGLLHWQLACTQLVQLSAAAPPCTLSEQQLIFSSGEQIVALDVVSKVRHTALACKETALAIAVQGEWLALAQPRRVSIQNLRTGAVACALRYKHYALQPLLALHSGRFALSGGLGNQDLWIRNLQGDLLHHRLGSGPWLAVHLGEGFCTAVCAPLGGAGFLEIHRIGMGMGMGENHSILQVACSSLEVALTDHWMLYWNTERQLAWHLTGSQKQDAQQGAGASGTSGVLASAPLLEAGMRLFLEPQGKSLVLARSEGNTSTLLQRWLLLEGTF